MDLRVRRSDRHLEDIDLAYEGRRVRNWVGRRRNEKAGEAQVAVEEKDERCAVEVYLEQARKPEPGILHENHPFSTFRVLSRGSV